MKINYDVTIPECETGFMQLWKKYSLKRTILFSVVFLIGAALFINMILKNLSSEGGLMFGIGGIGTGLSLGLLASLWLKPRRVWKKIAATLEMTYEERYTATFTENEIEIETLIQSEEDESVDKSRFVLAEEELYSKETNELFLLFVNRWLTYVFPKRCMSEQEANQLRDYFTLKRI